MNLAKDAMDEGTSTAQVTSSIPAVVEILDPHAFVAIAAQIIDFSKTRLRMLLEVELKDSYLLVKLNNYLLFGIVVDCHAARGAYEVELLVEEFLVLLPVENRPNTLIELIASSGSNGPESDGSSPPQPDSVLVRLAMNRV